MLNTDPPSVLADVARVKAENHLAEAVFDGALYDPNLLELSTIGKVLGLEPRAANAWSFDGDDAIKLELSLEECRYFCAPESRFGRNTMAAARTLLRFGGYCDGCDQQIDLTGEGARKEIFVHTVDHRMRLAPDSAVDDWPAVMCTRCHGRMAAEGHTRFVDFKFAQYPGCPECGARRTASLFYGMPSDHANIPPWRWAAGCCLGPERWGCKECGHDW
ncbi:hypothetical protein [Mycolicibacterium madagascariense]|uniref:hypothetical protein n=1 Tax=Mycolicibacterium madagascariense TaxID=212765 RepID=UPI001FE9F71C|nr:hypothetical protein [Mycolicibacterium madagascariense]